MSENAQVPMDAKLRSLSLKLDLAVSRLREAKSIIMDMTLTTETTHIGNLIWDCLDELEALQCHLRRCACGTSNEYVLYDSRSEEDDEVTY